jgi:hypothetical protein
MSNKIKKCWVVEVDDYHEFDVYKRAYAMAGLDTNYKEMNSQGFYFAVFWQGKKTKVVDDMIRELEIKLTW